MLTHHLLASSDFAYICMYVILLQIETKLYIQEVLDAAEEKKHDMKKFVSALVERIDNNRVEDGNGNVEFGKQTNGKSNGIHQFYP